MPKHIPKPDPEGAVVTDIVTAMKTADDARFVRALAAMGAMRAAANHPAGALPNEDFASRLVLVGQELALDVFETAVRETTDLDDLPMLAATAYVRAAQKARAVLADALKSAASDA